MPILTTARQLKETQGLKYLLHKHLSTTQKPRSLDILHASELTREEIEFCPRERAFLLKYGDNRKPEYVGTSLSVTYELGKFYEDKIRNEWLRSYVLGHWKCGECDYIHKYQTAPKKCYFCGAKGKKSKYIEPRAYSKKYDVSCGVDFFWLRGGSLEVVEVKSMDKDMFRDLTAPLSEHRRRTQFYLDLIDQSDWMDFDININLDHATILYVCKGFGFKDNNEGRLGVPDAVFSPFKEFTVKRGNVRDMTEIYEKALKVKKYNKTGVIPHREVCRQYDCTRAKRCTMKDKCFL
jgi:hypothetical protein